MYIYIALSLSLYIYIYIERERLYTYVYIYIYIEREIHFYIIHRAWRKTDAPYSGSAPLQPRLLSITSLSAVL